MKTIEQAPWIEYIEIKGKNGKKSYIGCWRNSKLW